MRTETAEWLKRAWETTDDDGSSMANRVFDVLMAGLLAGVLREGDRIVETDYNDLFGVSRTPIREAVLRLKTEDVLHRSADGSLVVRPISPDEIVEVYEVRESLDALAARLAAQRITEPALARLRWINDRMATAAENGDVAALADANIQFHDELFRAGGNTFLASQGASVHRQIRRFPGTPLSGAERARSVVAEHERIIAALQARDPEAAARAATDHISAARDERVKSLWG